MVATTVAGWADIIQTGLAIIAVAWLAPIGPMPGFIIGGTAAETPASWGDTSKTDQIRLEVQGDIPRVVIVWVVQVNGDLHVVPSNTMHNPVSEAGCLVMVIEHQQTTHTGNATVARSRSIIEQLDQYQTD